MVTPQNWVERDPTLKDMAKILKNKDGQNSQIGFGLMGYPVLMSADIMAVNTSGFAVLFFMADGALHLFICLQINDRRSADQALIFQSFFPFIIYVQPYAMMPAKAETAIKPIGEMPFFNIFPEPK